MASKILDLQNAELIMNFRNFRGIDRGKYPTSYPNFAVYVPEELVPEMLKDDWDIHEDNYHIAEGEPPRHYINVKVRFNSENEALQPQIFVNSNGKLTKLDKDTLGRLDYDEIEHVDLRVNGSYSERNGKRYGYASRMVVDIKPDWFDQKYGDAMRVTPEEDEMPF